MKNKPFYFCMQKVEGNVHQIYLYDDIEKHGDFNWQTWSYDESETSAAHFRDVLNSIPADAEIEIHFNTNGGSVSEGTSIYNLLQQHPAHKTGIVDGVCHSVGFTILQGCNTRIMGDGTSALIHNMWTRIEGNAKELRDAADRLDAYMESCIALYLKRCNLTEEQLRDMMDAETVLTPQKALEYALIDQIGVGAKEKLPTIESLQKENAELRMQIRNNDFNQKELKEFLESNKKEHVDSTGFGAFFNSKRRIKNED